MSVPRLAVVAALEALEVGDVGYATEILLGALEEGPHVTRARCACGAQFEWPGLLQRHVDAGACPMRRAA